MIWKVHPSFTGFSKLLLEKLDEWNPSDNIIFDRLVFKKRLESIIINHPHLLWNTNIQGLYNCSIRNNNEENLRILFLVKSIKPNLNISFKLKTNSNITFANEIFNFQQNKKYDLDKFDLFYNSNIDYSSSASLINNVYSDVETKFDSTYKTIFDENIFFLKNNLYEAFKWVNKLTKVVYPLHRENRNLKSTTRLLHPSTIFITFTTKLNQFLELLIHESAHWHFFHDNLDSTLLNNTDTLVYSPIKGCLRPIEKVYLGYHAIVYMYVLYKELRTLIPDEYPFFKKEEKIIISLLDKTSESMKEVSAYFTESGANLYKRLNSNI